MDTQGTIGLKATLDISEMQRNVQRYVHNINMMQNHTDTASASVAKSFGRMQAAAGAFLSIDMAKRLASEMVSVYGTFQQLEIAFRTMLHSGEKAKGLMEELVHFAAVTPFNLTDVGQGAKQLLAYGTAADRITTELEMLGNVASGVSVPLGDLIYLYGTLRSQGRASTVDIRQFAGRGIPIYEELAKVLNVSVGEVNTLVEAGRVGFPEVEKAFQNMTNKGGTFFNLMKDQSKSVTGQISNLMDNIDTKFNELGKSNDAFITAGINGANYLVDHYQEIGDALAALVVMYGVHKTALIANAAYYGALKKAESVAIINAEAEALKALETTEVKANLSKQGLTAGTKEYVEALKVEIKAEMDRLSQVALVANAEFDAAQDRLESANEMREQALQNIQLKSKELEAANASALVEKEQADAVKIAALEKKMALESEKQSRAALRLEKLKEDKDAAIAQARHLKEISASEEKIAAKNREIAKISEKIAAAKAEEVQHARNVVAYRTEIKAVDTAISSKAIEKAEVALNTAEQRLNTAEINRNTAARDLNNKKALVDSTVSRANTLQTGLNTAGVAANTAAKSVGTRVTGLLTAASTKLNAALAANAWTIALAGILAASYGIYKLITYQTDSEKAQAKLNDRFREFSSEVASEQTEIDRLFGKLDAAKEGTKEYDDAKKSIIDKYGEYLRGLGDEIESLKDVAKAYEAVSAAARQSAIDRAIADAKSEASDTYKESSKKHLDQLEKAIRSKIKNERDASALYSTIVQDIQKNGVLSDVAADIVQSFTKNVYSRGADGIERLSKIDNPIRDAVDALKKDNETLNSTFSDIEQKFGQSSVDYLSMTSEKIQGVIEGYEKAIKEGNSSIEIELELARAREALVEVQKEENKHVETVSERKVRWAKELVEAETILKQLKDDNSTATKKEIADQQKIVDTLKKDLEIDDKSVNSKKKKEEEANRIKSETADRLLAVKEAQNKIKQQEIDGELEIRQSQIDLLKDGSKKSRLQIQLDFDKRKNEINKYYADLLKQMQDQERKQWEADNPKWKDKGMTFNPTAKLSDSQMKEYANKMLLAYSSMVKTQADYYRSELEQYQTYQEKRKQVQGKYKKLREDAELSGNSSRIDEINREEKKAIEEVDKHYGEREDTFNAWSKSIVNFSLQQLVAMLEEAQTKMNLARMKSGNGTELGNTDEVAMYRAQIIELQNRIKELTVNTRAGTTTTYKDWKRLYEVLGDANSRLKEIGSSIGGATGEIISFASDITTSTLTMISSITELANWSTRATAEAASSASKAIQSVEKASVILAVISAALQIISAITNAFSALKEKEQEHEEYLKGIIDLQDSYNNELIKTRLLHDEVWGKNHIGDVLADIMALSDATKNYNSVLGEQQKAWQDPNGNFWKKLYKYGTIMGWAGMKPGQLMGVEEKGPGYTELVNNLRYITKKANKGFLGIGGNHTKTQDLRDWVKENLGDDLFDENGRLNLTIAQELVDNHTDRLAGETKDNLEKLIEAQKLIEEAEKALTDYISDTFGTLGDGLTDTIVDIFRNGKDAAHDFKDDIIGVLEEVGAQMVRNLFVQKAVQQYEKDLEKVYKKYAETEDQNQFTKELGQVTENFFSGAMTAIENGSKFLEFYQEEMKKHGFDLYKPEEDESSRTAVAKGLESVTQDSVNEVSGRLMATTIILNDILMAINRQADGQESVVLAMSDLKTASLLVNENVKIIKENMSIVIFYLKNIDANTSRLKGIQEDIVSVRVAVETMVDKGVTML